MAKFAQLLRQLRDIHSEIKRLQEEEEDAAL